MRVIYDHQVFTAQRFGGISRYFYELAKGLRLTGVDARIISPLSDNHYLAQDRPCTRRTFFPHLRFRGKARIVDPVNRMACAIAVRKGAFDIFHPTYYDPRCVASLRGKPFVITIHDMIHELFPGDFPNSSVPEGKKQLAMKARRIIAISETTKRDIVRLYGIDDAKIDVIYHGNSLTLPADGPRPTCLPARYLLFVGNRGIYKNFRLCTEAFARLTPDDPLLSLVCVGGPFSGPEVGLLQSLGIADKVKQMQVSDETLALAYQYALAFVFPSLYEGFGIPLLEAFSCECPVIASRASCFPEIAADAAEYFDPADTGSLLEAIKKVILVPGRAKELRELGRLRARSFTWEKTCLETLASYMRALGEAA